MIFCIGDKTETSTTITESDIISFANISGDCNPVHINPQAAEQSIFGKQVAHGMLVGSLISKAIGMQLPGPGTIYMEQDLKFLRPVYIGDTITAEVELADIINEQKNILKLSTKVINQHSELVIDGFAVVKAP